MSNRIAQFHVVSTPNQWCYVPTHLNPADAATRRSVSNVQTSLDSWLPGPVHLCTKDVTECDQKVDYPLVDPENDKDIRPEVIVFKAYVSSSLTSIEDRFARFSSWEKLVSALSTLRHVCASFRGKCKCTGWHICKELRCEPLRKDTEGFILRSVQAQAFRDEIEAIKGQHDLPKNSRIQDLSPYIDEESLLRVGGRLNNMRNTGLGSVNPVIIPGGNSAHTFLPQQGFPPR